MAELSEKEAVALLRKYARSDKDFEGVLEHVEAVRDLAVEMAEKINAAGKIHVDVDFVRVAALLHDIGRFDHPPGTDTIKHGVRGAEIIRSEGLDERYARVCECHLGPGVTREDIKRMNLPIPLKEYVPESVEEKIISVADNLTMGDREMTDEKVVERFTNELGPEVGERTRKLHAEIRELMR